MSDKILFDYQKEIPLLPSEPGIYKYIDSDGKIIYVGKAKNLKNRISSYFYNFDKSNGKTKALIKKIARLEYTVTPTERDALLLENNLIKEHQPKYNILLRDDKNYPYICLTKERFPRLITTRRMEDKKKGKIYGPYVNAKAMHAMLDLVNSLFKVRTCKYNLSQENIENNKFKVCLEYHIGNCLGPCVGLQSEDDYMYEIKQIKALLKGNIKPALKYFEAKMLEAASAKNYELAHNYKLKLEHLNSYYNKAVVVNTSIKDTDVFTIQSDDKFAYINYLKINNGIVSRTRTFEVKKMLNETNEEILTQTIVDTQQQFGSQAKEILSNISIDEDFLVPVVVPKIGDKHKLIEMSMRNIMFYRHEKAEKENIEKTGNSNRRDRVLIKLKNDLQLPDLPRRIECIDNSNIQGTNPVSAVVVFVNGQPAKKEYRHYIPQTVEGPDDYATMYEVVKRRYSRLIKENKELPNLIIIDGGKGQLSASTKALKDIGIYGQIPIIGIAKRLEEIYFPEDSVPLYIDKKSESLKLIQQARDEAHRFGITHHRNRRSKAFLVSSLESAPGIGKNTAEKALKHFKSINGLKAASDEELIEVLGKDKARRIREFINNES